MPNVLTTDKQRILHSQELAIEQKYAEWEKDQQALADSADRIMRKEAEITAHSENVNRIQEITLQRSGALDAEHARMEKETELISQLMFSNIELIRRDGVFRIVDEGEEFLLSTDDPPLSKNTKKLVELIYDLNRQKNTFTERAKQIDDVAKSIEAIVPKLRPDLAIQRSALQAAIDLKSAIYL